MNPFTAIIVSQRLMRVLLRSKFCERKLQFSRCCQSPWPTFTLFHNNPINQNILQWQSDSNTFSCQRGHPLPHIRIILFTPLLCRASKVTLSPAEFCTSHSSSFSFFFPSSSSSSSSSWEELPPRYLWLVMWEYPNYWLQSHLLHYLSWCHALPSHITISLRLFT